MTGGFKFQLKSKRLQYEILIKRKITRITGESAKGKSELVRALEDAGNLYAKIDIQCDYECYVLNNNLFKEIVRSNINRARNETASHGSAGFAEKLRSLLKQYDNILFFADESFSMACSDEFSLFCKFTDSFFVLINRSGLPNLPYSYTDIYNIKTSGKFHWIEPVYNQENFNVFRESATIITEDSNSGFEFFNRFYSCVKPAGGKSNIIQLLENVTGTVVIVADGAAFGSEIEILTEKIAKMQDVVLLFLPESFEYLLLSSGLFKNTEVQKKIKEPVSQVSGLFFSWEQFFTYVIKKYTERYPCCYSKHKLNKCYLEDCCFREVSVCCLSRMTDKKEAVLGKYLEMGDCPRLNIF
ncbi:MAG: hypothetical protein HFH68_14205 [Lachnospiraceae bacterium]|nr:hypothetical protein [Lachnospiraceae bacterium]